MARLGGAVFAAVDWGAIVDGAGSGYSVGLSVIDQIYFQRASRWAGGGNYLAGTASHFVFALVKGLALFAQTVMVNALALRVSTDLQKDMAKNLIEADLQTISGEPAGVFMSRIMNDLNLVREAFVRLANNLVRDSLTVIVLVGAMFWLDWLMAFVVLAVYPLAMQPIIRIGNRQRKASGNLQTHMEDVTSLLAETLQGTRMVKAYQLEEQEIGRTRAAFDGLYQRLVGC